MLFLGSTLWDVGNRGCRQAAGDGQLKFPAERLFDHRPRPRSHGEHLEAICVKLKECSGDDERKTHNGWDDSQVMKGSPAITKLLPVGWYCRDGPSLDLFDDRNLNEQRDTEGDEEERESDKRQKKGFRSRAREDEDWNCGEQGHRHQNGHDGFHVLAHALDDREEDSRLEGGHRPAQRQPRPPKQSSDESQQHDADEFRDLQTDGCTAFIVRGGRR
jgi:hypothetical protein